MGKRCWSSALVVLSAMSCVLADHVDADELPAFSFSGFGTAGIVHSSEEHADFTSSLLKPDGAGYSHEWSADVDSLIAAQLTADFSPQISAVVQVISEQNYDNSYQPEFEWANIKYSFTPDFNIRLGRIVLPSFLLSENRKVAYTFPWIRPPHEVYGLNLFTNSDGADVNYHQQFGEIANSIQLIVRRKKDDLPNGSGTVKASHILCLSDNLDSGPFSAHFSYQRFDVKISSLEELGQAYRSLGPQGASIEKKYDLQSLTGSLLGTGFSYDPGNWFVTSEWSKLSGSQVYAKSGWYISTGYRFDNFIPYIIYAESNARQTFDSGVDVNAVSPELANSAVALNAALNQVLRLKPVNNTISIGGRWDFFKNTDFKLQFDHSRFYKNSTGGLINIQPGYQYGATANVFSAAIDFVF